MPAPTANIFVLVGAGPSLDYARGEVDRLFAAGAQFLVSDSIAAGFLKCYPQIDATVFTVEPRRHMYLTRISGISLCSVMAYRHVPAANLRFTKARLVTRFKLRGEEGDLPEFYSPGTVLGIMLSFAVKALSSGGDIHILGADFSYIDNQIYSRFIDRHAPLTDRLLTREKWQFEMALKKAGGVILKSGHAIRTAFELMQSRENMRGYIAALPKATRIIEYSPIGFDTGTVEKRIPS